MTQDLQSLLNHLIEGEVAKDQIAGHSRDPSVASSIPAGATAGQVRELEDRLDTKLPASYREFLIVANGVPALGPSRLRLRPTQDVKWFREENESFIESWGTDAIELSDEKYFVYGDEQDPVWIRSAYLNSCLQISDEIDGYVYLLNPEIQTTDGEWEAWDFGVKLPGAVRYRTFLEMLQGFVWAIESAKE